MPTEKNIIGELWTFIDKESYKTKIANKVFNWLNCDNLSGIIVLDNKQFYFEFTGSFVVMPNYIYSYLIKWATKQGFEYMYNH